MKIESNSMVRINVDLTGKFDLVLVQFTLQPKWWQRTEFVNQGTTVLYTLAMQGLAMFQLTSQLICIKLRLQLDGTTKPHLA